VICNLQALKIEVIREMNKGEDKLINGGSLRLTTVGVRKKKIRWCKIQSVNAKLRTEYGGGWVWPVRWMGSYDETNLMRVRETDQGR
jgi:hypothetical protein